MWRAWTRVPRPIRWLLVLLAGIELFWLVVANLFVATPLLRTLVNRKPDSARLEYERAWTWLPPTVHVRGFQLRIQDSVLQFELRVREAEVDVNVFALVERQFHATRVVAEGTVFRLRQRLPETDANDWSIRGLVPIDGFPTPPLLSPSGPDPDPTEKEYSLWCARLDDIDAGFEELWIDQYRFDIEDGRATGNFDFKPLRHLAFDAHLRHPNATLTIADRLALERFESEAKVALSRVELQTSSSEAILGHMSGSLRANGDLRVAGLQHWLGPSPPGTLRAGTAAFDVDLELDRGELARGSVLAARYEGVSFEMPRLRTETSGELELVALSLGTELIGTMSGSVVDRKSGQLVAGLLPSRYHFRAATRFLDRQPPFPTGEVRAALSVPDVANVVALASKKKDGPRVSGPLMVRGQLGLGPARAATLNLQAESERLEMFWDSWRAAGPIDLFLAGGVDDLFRSPYRAAVATVRLDRVSYRNGDEDMSSWRGMLELPRLTLDPRGGSFDAVVRGSASDAELILSLPPIDESVPDLIAPGLLDVDHLETEAALSFRGQTLLIELRHAEVDGASANGHVRLGPDRRSGRILVDTGPVEVDIDLSR